MPSKPPTSKPAAKPPVSKPNVPKVPDKPGKAVRQTKTFSVAPICGDNEGEKLVIYGKSGFGKTTLAAQVKEAVFIALDDGARKILNPVTGEPCNAIVGVEDFDDLRDAVKQASSLISGGGTLVIDTITRAQSLAEQWVVNNVSLEKGGKAKNLEHFGFGKGYRHTLDAFRNLLSDFDSVIRSGRNVVLLAQLDQAIVPNPAGVDYYEEVPKLIENKQGPLRTEMCEWSDHVLRIGYLDFGTSKDSADARVGKVSTSDDTRAIYSGGGQHFMAKSRPINGSRIPPVIGFESPEDNSLWQFVLEGATA